MCSSRCRPHSMVDVVDWYTIDIKLYVHTTDKNSQPKPQNIITTQEIQTPGHKSIPNSDFLSQECHCHHNKNMHMHIELSTVSRFTTLNHNRKSKRQRGVDGSARIAARRNLHLNVDAYILNRLEDPGGIAANLRLWGMKERIALLEQYVPYEITLYSVHIILYLKLDCGCRRERTIMGGICSYQYSAHLQKVQSSKPFYLSIETSYIPVSASPCIYIRSIPYSKGESVFRNILEKDRNLPVIIDGKLCTAATEYRSKQGPGRELVDLEIIYLWPTGCITNEAKHIREDWLTVSFRQVIEKKSNFCTAILLKFANDYLLYKPGVSCTCSLLISEPCPNMSTCFKFSWFCYLLPGSSKIPSPLFHSAVLATRTSRIRATCEPPKPNTIHHAIENHAYPKRYPVVTSNSNYTPRSYLLMWYNFLSVCERMHVSQRTWLIQSVECGTPLYRKWEWRIARGNLLDRMWF